MRLDSNYLVCGQCLANSNHDDPPPRSGEPDGPHGRDSKSIVVHGKSGGDEEVVLSML